jgi:hypothetical protein
MTYKIVEVSKLEKFAIKHNARLDTGYGGRSGGSKGRAVFVLNTGVTAHLNFVMVVTYKGSGAYFYCRDYRRATHVRIDDWWGTVFNFFGRGARSTDTWTEAEAYLNDLLGD